MRTVGWRAVSALMGVLLIAYLGGIYTPGRAETTALLFIAFMTALEGANNDKEAE